MEPSEVAPGVAAELSGAATGGVLLIGGAEAGEPSAVAGGTGASCADSGAALRTTIAPRAVRTPKRTFFKRSLLAAETPL
jgi:hypothetical protein